MIRYRTLSQFTKLYVVPEIERRLAAGRLAEEDLPIAVRTFRVVLPATDARSPYVELDDEIDLQLKVADPKSPVVAGQPVGLQDIDPKKCYVIPPEVDGKPASYFFARSEFVDFAAVFDFTHTGPEATGQAKEPVGPAFDVVRLVGFRQYVERVRPNHQLKRLADLNWPPSPAYFPAVLEHVAAGHDDPESLTECVHAACNRTFWEQRLSDWEALGFFPQRIRHLRRAVQAHFEGEYLVSIPMLAPQVEGILVAYLGGIGQTSSDGFKAQVSRLEKVLFSRRILLWDRGVVETTLQFIRDSTFWSHSGNIGDHSQEINRHGVVHGTFTEFDSQTISLKFLLLLDGLIYLLLHDRVVRGDPLTPPGA